MLLQLINGSAISRVARERGSAGERMQRQDERDIRELLVRLRNEHRELDAQIASLEADSLSDQLQISRLKRTKLKLKDAIAGLEDQLLPDIIA